MNVHEEVGYRVSMIIREATVRDAEDLRDYAIRLFAERLPGLFRRPDPTIEEEIAFIESHVRPDNAALFIAEEDGRIVGLLGFMGRSMPQEIHTGSVGLSVDSSHRGNGVGTALLRHLFAWAPEHGVSRIEIEAFANNPGAVRLYERCGFEREGIRRHAVEVNGELIDVVSLAKLV